MLREPLLHFAALGALIFGVYAWWGPEPAPSQPSLVVPYEALSQRFEAKHGRAPGPADRQALVERWIDDEVLYREALARGLDRDDPVIRGRLVEKMRFVVAAVVVAPSETALDARLADNPALYQAPERLGLQTVFVRKGPDASVRATELLTRLREGVDPATLGNPLPIGQALRGKSLAQIGARLGKKFAEAVGRLPVGKWHGPVGSSFGLHLVRVEQRAAGGAVDRAALRRDARDDERVRAERAAIDRLRAQYQVEGP
ncbi:MAG: peptidyl-prolyl cis-trans isomerase C [Myxococcota bacterium]|jgi:peptidyl-prolyl cis-trans isomerase C